MQQSRLQKYSKIIICLGGMILLCVGTGAFAQTPPAQTSDVLNFNQWLQQIITLFSWLRVVFAMGAGKLMSNSFVYGEFMNFDVYLWQMWNISKNFANLAIGFMFLFYILKFVFQSEEVTGNEIGKKIGWFLLAGVLIQASWFMMGALLDIEKIATSAMGSLPALVIQDDNSRWQSISSAMENSAVLWNRLELKSVKQWNNPTYLIHTKTQISGSSQTPEWTLDAILPSNNTLSWPLYFIGFAIFKFQNYSDVPIGEDLTLEDASWILSAIGIKFLILAAFVIMMLLLFVINIIRIAYLWMVIALAPIIVLYLVLKDVLGMDIGWDSSIMSKIKIETILAYIFQPTIIIAFMGLMLIAVTALWQGMPSGATPRVVEEYGFTISNTWFEHATFSVQTEWDIFDDVGDQSKWILANFIVLWLVFALLLWLITLSAMALKIDFITNIAKSLWPTLAKVPFMPILNIWWAANKIITNTTGVNLANLGSAQMDKKWENALRDMLGMDRVDDASSTYLSKLNDAIDKPTTYVTRLHEWRDAAWEKWLSFKTTPWLTNSLVNFINKNDGKLANYGLSPIKDALWQNGDWTPKKLTAANFSEYLGKNENAKELFNVIVWNPKWTYNDATADKIITGTISLKANKPKATTTP